MQDNEKRFEQDIESHLLNSDEYRKLTMNGYDASFYKINGTDKVKLVIEGVLNRQECEELTSYLDKIRERVKDSKYGQVEPVVDLKFCHSKKRA